MKLKKVLTGLLAGTALMAAQAQAAPILTDIVFVVDESGSMGTVQTNLRNNIGLFASILTGTGQVNARYGLVGYGDTNIVPRMITDFTDETTFATKAGELRRNGGTEPGYTATAFALNALDSQSPTFSYRSNAVKNIIILSDEASNGDRADRGSIGGSAVNSTILDTVLSSNNALYNGVLSYGAVNSYSSLIKSHGGTVFDLNQFNTTNTTTITNFVTDFANTKLKETLGFCDLYPTDPACLPSQNVPEPGTLGLLSLALGGLVFRRRLSKFSATS